MTERIGLLYRPRNCSACGVEKPAEKFGRGRSVCNACRGAAYRAANLERTRAQARERAQRRPAEAKRRSTAEWKARNPGKVAEQRARERAAQGRAPIEPKLDRDVRLRAQHARRLERARRPRLTPLERYRLRMQDPAYVINMRMRVAIRKALKGGKAGRRWESLVGYTLADLVAHLERQMPRGLSLADIGSGRLHIDHIVPKVVHDVTTPEGLRAAWCLSNLRPLAAADNLRKGARREFLL